MKEYIIEFDNVSKTYKRGKQKIYALKSLNLKVPSGVFGFLGRNGAGKTTTIKLLLGLIKPNSGKISILGKSPDSVSIKKKIGYLPEITYLDREFTAYELLKFYGNFYKIEKKELEKRIDEYLAQFELLHYKKEKIRNFSKGMMQKISIIQAVLPDPELLILDEPTSGLDPISQHEIREFIKSYKDKGKTIFLSSHFLDEVEEVCDYIGILDKGKLLRFGKKEQLLQYKDHYIFIIQGKIDEILKQYNGEILDENKGKIEVGENEYEKVFKELSSKKVKIIEYFREKEHMHEFFLRILEENHE